MRRVVKRQFSYWRSSAYRRPMDSGDSQGRLGQSVAHTLCCSPGEKITVVENEHSGFFMLRCSWQWGRYQGINRGSSGAMQGPFMVGNVCGWRNGVFVSASVTVNVRFPRLPGRGSRLRLGMARDMLLGRNSHAAQVEQFPLAPRVLPNAFAKSRPTTSKARRQFSSSLSRLQLCPSPQRARQTAADKWPHVASLLRI